MPRRPPDHRPPWQSAPVIRDYKMSDGTRKTEVDPDYERRYREMLIETSKHPSWKNDPTYDMRRKK